MIPKEKKLPGVTLNNLVIVKAKRKKKTPKNKRESRKSAKVNAESSGVWSWRRLIVLTPSAPPSTENFKEKGPQEMAYIYLIRQGSFVARVNLLLQLYFIIKR